MAQYDLEMLEAWAEGDHLDEAQEFIQELVFEVLERREEVAEISKESAGLEAKLDRLRSAIEAVLDD